MSTDKESILGTGRKWEKERESSQTEWWGQFKHFNKKKVIKQGGGLKEGGKKQQLMMQAEGIDVKMQMALLPAIGSPFLIQLIACTSLLSLRASSSDFFSPAF